uniref:Spermatogenesis associated 18 n=1 Tax=Steinernema glaseri TaxID=37863 RepID=A0A1I8AI62_9BILA
MYVYLQIQNENGPDPSPFVSARMFFNLLSSCVLTLADCTRQARHERLLEEEREIMQRGVDVTNRLLSWYSDRLTSIAKRKEMLNKGIVALDTSVHEQKLNFVRANITELNRRMAALCESSERGFPTHGNLAKSQLPQPADETSMWLHKQNKRLTDELEEKTRLLEQLQKEKRLVELRHMTPSAAIRVPNHRHSAMLERPSAYVKPALHQQPQIYMRPIIPTPVKVHDTLL